MKSKSKIKKTNNLQPMVVKPRAPTAPEARPQVKLGQFYITCPVGIGLGCISKWLGWI